MAGRGRSELALYQHSQSSTLRILEHRPPERFGAGEDLSDLSRGLRVKMQDESSVSKLANIEGVVHSAL